MGFYNPDNTKKSKEQINFEIKKINALNKEFWDRKDRNNRLEKYIVIPPPAEPKEEIEIKITRPKRKFI